MWLRVCEAEDGETALSAISVRQLPGILLDAAKTSARRILPLLITGYSSNTIKRRVDSLGAAYFEKPLRIQELERTIQERVGR